MGFSTTKTTELKSVGDATQIVALLIGGIITLNIPNSRLLTATVANILCTVSAACLAYLPRSNTWGRLVSFWLINSQSVGFAVSLVTISSNMAGYTHRSVASAMVLWVSPYHTKALTYNFISTARLTVGDISLGHWWWRNQKPQNTLQLPLASW